MPKRDGGRTLEKALGLIGLSAPFVYAGGMYSLCLLLDRNASLAAKKALSQWLQAERYTGGHVSNLALQIFDRIFSAPLLSIHAFMRSAALSLAVMTIVIYSLFPMIFYFYVDVPEIRPLWSYHVLKNIFCDYCSLFIIRRWLIVAGSRPVFAMITGPFFGAAAVYVIYIVLDVTRFSLLISGEFHLIYFVQGTLQYLRQFQQHTANSVFTTAAFAVHGWLLLFGIGMAAAKLINSFRSATSWAQWFLKNGRQHPFRAVGLTSSCLVFVCATIAQLFGSR